MVVFKPCECGGTHFYDDDEGGGTWRCEDCGRLARFEFREDKGYEIQKQKGDS